MRSFAKHVTSGFAALFTLAATLPLHAQEESPYTQPDGSWITLTGTVAEASDESFSLDYGPGLVTVEMDDWDWYAEGRQILEGDKVTVYGKVDDDLYELTSVEASSVYVESLNTYFYANPADEEDLVVATPVVVDTWVEVTGEVVSKDGREFEVKMGDNSTMTVDTASMSYNPLDDQGFQQIDKGDRVRVTGHIDDTFFDGRELSADTLITLVHDQGKEDAYREAND